MHETIKKDTQIKKFGLYGFFKNLKFFEPYLLVYLISLDYSLFSIGVLFALREIIVYVFEIPSGIIADTYGKKKELLICFGFYIISFVCFFLGTSGFILAAMIMYGLGDAFRSGTHKAMIISYLEKNKWSSEKTFVYGRTRSFSLLGSAISSLLSIIFILEFDSLRFIFLLSIIPYIIDFLLILSYPSYLDEPSGEKFSLSVLKSMGFNHLKSLKSNKDLQSIILSSAFYDSIFKTIKDYVQPILLILVFANEIKIFESLNEADASKVFLGIIYFGFYICSSQASKNLYKLTKRINGEWLYNIAFIFSAVISLALVIFINIGSVFGVAISFLLFYVIKDSRRPLFVELSSNHMKKSERATMLSVDSQVKAILVVILGPLFGFIADRFSISMVFVSLVFINLLLFYKFKSNDKR